MEIDQTFIIAYLRKNDRNRYLASLLLPDSVRLAIAVLYGFNAETSRIRDFISEPFPGEIRLQWWREVTAENTRQGEMMAHPLAYPLHQVIDIFHLDRASFDHYCRSRIFDLYDDPMPDTWSYENYCRETASALLLWSCQIINQEKARDCEQICFHAGIAQSVAGHLAAMAFHRSRGQIYIPMDILQRYDFNHTIFLAHSDRTNLKRIITDFVEYGRGHLERAGMMISALSPEMKPAFLPLAPCARILRKAEKFDVKCLDMSPAPQAWLCQWDLWKYRKKGLLQIS